MSLYELYGFYGTVQFASPLRSMPPLPHIIGAHYRLYILQCAPLFGRSLSDRSSCSPGCFHAVPMGFRVERGSIYSNPTERR